MLIFVRKPGQGGYIGEDVFFTVLAVKGNQVRFGFEAPKDIDINRQEIYERIHQRIDELTEGQEE